jgi:DNA-binding CsgD family transcriptional regulator
MRHRKHVNEMNLIEPFCLETAGELFEAAHGPCFAASVLKAAQTSDAIEEIFACRISDAGKPEMLFSCSELSNNADRAIAYSNHFYSRDPVASRLNQLAPGTSFSKLVNAREISWDQYRRICFESPQFTDKLCFGWRVHSETLILSFYRKRPSQPCEMPRLGGLAYSAMSAFKAAESTRCLETLEDRLEVRLSKQFPSLTNRERQICARTINGWTADRIADSLGIRRSTVLTYRQRAYERLSFTCATDFLPFVIH